MIFAFFAGAPEGRWRVVCGAKSWRYPRRAKDGTILKSTFFGALVLRMGTFVMRRIRYGGD
jgi:hypothetical protein